MTTLKTRVLVGVLVLGTLMAGPIASACPFCSAVSQTLRQEMEVMDAVVVATALQSDLTRNADTGQIKMRIETVLKGGELVEAGQEVTAVYFGDVAKGRRFMLSGVDPRDMQWSCLPLTPKSEKYLEKITQLADKEPSERLLFYYEYLQDEDSMLSRDAYDEFASTPYDEIKKIESALDHDTLVTWIQDPKMSPDRKRMYLTLLGICGDQEDLPMLESMLKSTQKSSRSGLDALIACYLTFAGEQGLPVIDELFLENRKASYADTYAAIMAVRFHGSEGGVIARSALVQSLHHILDRPDLADLVIPDLARWKDWSQIDRIKQLFLAADAENNWVRVPAVNYLRACPKPEAAEAIKELEKVDPDSVRRANTFFAVPKPSAEVKAVKQ
ncbi:MULTISPECIES: hypothetical protein [Rhodopirellula]|uniref:hypothetical protein n=1 Tax=Rhodopirellula TaxID=265488 RepID=UPI00257AE03D|nr:hypothetical protein [Rhodopirellula sp. UBA1907]|tara:strand:+ start:4879 stop:6036 length:1158 start_codon:yes stop_codon:yes gene_type:complete